MNTENKAGPEIIVIDDPLARRLEGLAKAHEVMAKFNAAEKHRKRGHRRPRKSKAFWSR